MAPMAQAWREAVEMQELLPLMHQKPGVSFVNSLCLGDLFRRDVGLMSGAHLSQPQSYGHRIPEMFGRHTDSDIFHRSACSLSKTFKSKSCYPTLQQVMEGCAHAMLGALGDKALKCSWSVIWCLQSKLPLPEEIPIQNSSNTQTVVFPRRSVSIYRGNTPILYI